MGPSPRTGRAHVAGDAVKRKVLGRLHELRIYGDGQRRKFIERSRSRAGSSSTRRRTRRTEFDACSLVHTYPHTVLSSTSFLACGPLAVPLFLADVGWKGDRVPSTVFQLDSVDRPLPWYRGIVVLLSCMYRPHRDRAGWTRARQWGVPQDPLRFEQRGGLCERGFIIISSRAKRRWKVISRVFRTCHPEMVQYSTGRTVQGARHKAQETERLECNSQYRWHCTEIDAHR